MSRDSSFKIELKGLKGLQENWQEKNKYFIIITLQIKENKELWQLYKKL